MVKDNRRLKETGRCTGCGHISDLVYRADDGSKWCEECVE